MMDSGRVVRLATSLSGAVTSVDNLSDHDLPEVAHNPSTDVCPD
jgi:hypothetical protein